MADKTPVRYAYDGSSLTGIAEYATSDTVGVPFGGTGATSLTDNGILVGNAAGAIQVTSALTTNGQVVVGGTSGPAVANISGTSNEVEITNGDGTITIGLPSDLLVAVANGGTGATSLTDDGILLGNGTAAVQATAALTTNGQVVVGGTSGPAVANISGTTNEVEITNGDGTITVGLPSTISGLTNVSATNLTGTLATAAQTNITSIGTLSTLLVSGSASATSIIVADSGAALASQNASKIILVDLNDPATMWNVEAFLARARFTSWYQELGAPPMRGAIFLNNANTSIVWWNLDTDTQYISFDVGGSSNDDANMIYITSIKPSCIAFLDGKIYFGVSVGGGGGAWSIDLLRDECIGWFASGQRRYEGNIEERNDGKGNISTRTSVQIKNGTVSGIAATRDMELSDEFDRPVQWWSAGTSSGASIYNPHKDAIYDWHDSNRNSTQQFLMNDKWMFMRNQTTYQGVNWIQMSAVDADNVAVIQHFNPWNSADGSNRYQYSMPWDKSATITGIVGNSAASQVYLASTQGLCRITFPTEDNIYGWIWTTSTYQTPYMKGTRVAAYPLNDVNDRSKGTGQTLTNNNSVTFAAGGPTGNYADFVAASSQSLTLADHANFGGMSELTLSCWVNRDIDAAGDVGILSKFSTTDASSQSFTLVVYNGGGDTIIFEINTSGGASSAISITPLVVGEWTHIVATYDGTNMKLYMNGLIEATTARTGTIDDSAEQFIIGARSGNTNTAANFFDGKIGGVYIGATAMTYNEVKLEYQRGLRVLSGATAKLANTDVKSVRVDEDTGLAAVTTAANQTEIWDIETGLRQSIDATTTATIADADVALKTGATLPEYITARSGAIEFDGQTRSVV